MTADTQGAYDEYSEFLTPTGGAEEMEQSNEEPGRQGKLGRCGQIHPRYLEARRDLGES